MRLNSETVTIGVIGLGRGLVLTLPALRQHPHVRIAGGYDLRSEAVKKFAEEFGGVAYRSHEEMLSDPSVDAVYVATPHEIHARITCDALKAGKHVLVEKPMSTTLEDGLEMVRVSQETGKILLVGPSHGFDRPIQEAGKLIRSGRYGRVRMVTALNYTDFMYRPRRPEELDEARGGGVVYSQATHQIDLVRNLVNQPVESIRAVTGNWDETRGSSGAYTALMTFSEGAAASLTYSGYAHYDSDELVGWIGELGRPKDPESYGQARRLLQSLKDEGEQDAKLSRTYGGEGMAEQDTPPYHEHFGFVLASCDEADLKILPTEIQIFGNTQREVIPIPPPEIPRAAVIDEFVAAINGVAKPIHDGYWALETMACCTAIIESSRMGRDVQPAALINAHERKTRDDQA